MLIFLMEIANNLVYVYYQTHDIIRGEANDAVPGSGSIANAQGNKWVWDLAHRALACLI